jgi:type IV pilus assembly protein PilO
MTYADPDFIPVEEQEEEPSYPEAFGITFTPKVAGIILAILGLGGAAYLAWKVVQPALVENQGLRAQRQEKEGQLQDPQEIQQQIQQKQQELVQVKQQNQTVTGLFADEQSANTLLLDVNRFIKDADGKLTSYEPVQVNEEESNIVTDGSLGAAVNGKLKRQSFNLEMEGSFNAIQSILRSIERLQTLVVVKELTTDISTPQGLLVDDQGTVTPIVEKDEQIIRGAPPTLTTSYRLDVLMPLSEEQKQAEMEAEAAAEEGAQ